jgi:hypothetical protein
VDASEVRADFGGSATSRSDCGLIVYIIKCSSKPLHHSLLPTPNFLKSPRISWNRCTFCARGEIRLNKLPGRLNRPGIALGLKILRQVPSPHTPLRPRSRRKLRNFQEPTRFPRYIKEIEIRMGIHNPLPSSMACKYTFSSGSHLSGQLTDPPHYSGVQEVREDSSILRRPSTGIRTRQDHSSSDPRERKGIYASS